VAEIGSAGRERVATALHEWTVLPSGTLGFGKAEVTLGGVDTGELSSRTMEARRVPGLYFIGEVVDVTGWLGGYNFQWAWSSGWVAGSLLEAPSHWIIIKHFIPFLTHERPSPLTLDVPREFHRRMAAIIDAVQTGMWQAGVHDLLGYATDYAFGQQRGVQTLVLKSKHRSAYVRLHWDTIMGDTDADRQRVDAAIKSAINELT